MTSDISSRLQRIAKLQSNCSSSKLEASATLQSGRLIFAIDATASRQATWDRATAITVTMFKAAIGLQMNLTYFRGSAKPVATGWTGNAAQMVRTMERVHCHSGLTQLEAVLKMIRAEHEKRPVSAFILVTDTCEEDHNRVAMAAEGLKVPGFVFHEKTPDSAGTFTLQRVAEMTGGVYLPFDENSTDKLKGLLTEIAAFATNGMAALEASKSPAAKLLLNHLKGG